MGYSRRARCPTDAGVPRGTGEALARDDLEARLCISPETLASSGRKQASQHLQHGRVKLVPSGRELRMGGDARIRGKEQPAVSVPRVGRCSDSSNSVEASAPRGAPGLLLPAQAAGYFEILAARYREDRGAAATEAARSAFAAGRVEAAAKKQKSPAALLVVVQGGHAGLDDRRARSRSERRSGGCPV